ncbi:MAG: hypothetical protein EBT12_15505, partial [Marivivens sp.]|nr:hypothetical protein [Marivivens sp.]
DDFAKLLEDIREHGQREPVILYDGKILDGRNRYRACVELGIPPLFEHSKASTDDEALRESVSRNLHRRHLTASQKAMIGADLLPMFEAMAKDRQGERTDIRANLRECSKATGSKASAQAAEVAQVSARSVESAKNVKADGIPDLVSAVRAGDIAVSRAEEVSKLEPELQREVVARVQDGEKASEVVREIKTSSLGALLMSESNEWYTPSEYVEAARRVMGSIDLDPASCPQANETVNASTFYTKEDDGFTQTWSGKVWCNPPYGKDDGESNQGRWTRRLIDAYESGEIEEAVFLVNAVTDRSWFEPFWNYAICFVSRRIKFYSPDKRSANPTHGSVIVYLGDDIEAFIDHFQEFGRIVVSVPNLQHISTCTGE